MLPLCYNQFNIPMYRLYRQDIKNNEGGIMMYIRNDMPQFRRHDIEYFSTNNKDGRIEVLAVEVTINKEKWLFISTVQITFIFIDFRVCDFAFAFKTQNAPCVSRFKRVLFSDRFQFAF